MKHYVFLKFPAGFCTMELLDGMKRILKQAQDTIPGFEHYQILKELNASGAYLAILIILKFVSAVEKDNYLQHPLHLTLLHLVKPVITEKCVFDSKN